MHDFERNKKWIYHQGVKMYHYQISLIMCTSLIHTKSVEWAALIGRIYRVFRINMECGVNLNI